MKPGGIGISMSSLMLASDLALSRALTLHSSLVNALQELETAHAQKLARRLDELRLLREAQSQYHSTLATLSSSSSTTNGDREAGMADGGLNLSDPILRYDYTHVTSGCTVSKTTAA